MEGALKRHDPRFFLPMYQYIRTCDYRWQRLGSLVYAKACGHDANAYRVSIAQHANRPARSGHGNQDRGNHADYRSHALSYHRHGR